MYNCHCERQKLLSAVQMHDFAMQDLALYLDSHPTCRYAMACFQKHKRERMQAAAMYTAKFGPLTVQDQDCDTQWNWVCNPWPWELEG